MSKLLGNVRRRLVVSAMSVMLAVLIVAATALAASVTGDGTLIGTTGNDNINAGNGNDTVYGLGGLDSINAGNGNDVIDGNGKCPPGVKSGDYPHGLPNGEYFENGPI